MSSDSTPADTVNAIVLQVSLAIRKNTNFGLVVFKLLKSSTLNSFSLAVLLCLSRVHRFEEPVFEFLKSALLQYYKDAEKKNDIFDLPKIESMFLSLPQNKGMVDRLSNVMDLICKGGIILTRVS